MTLERVQPKSCLLQEAIGWYSSARAHLLELIDCDSFAEISQRVDGESGRFPAGASYRGRPLFLGDSPDGALYFPLYTGYGRGGFPRLPLLESPDDPPKPSQIEGQIARVDGRYLFLDESAALDDRIYVGSTIQVEGKGGTYLGVVVGYRGCDRRIELIDRVHTESATYTLRSRLTNCYLVGRGEVEVSPVWSDPDRRQLKEWIEQIDQHLEQLREGAFAGERGGSASRFLEANYRILGAHAYFADLSRRLEQN